MLDTKVNQDITVRITPKVETLLGELCVAVKHFDESLDTVNFCGDHRFGTYANFHTHDTAMPDMSVGDLVNWVNTFACAEGPGLAHSEPVGEALVKGRARQLHAMIKPLATRIDEIANDPSYRGVHPFLFSVMAHPKVFWAFDELCSKMATLAK